MLAAAAMVLASSVPVRAVRAGDGGGAAEAAVPAAATATATATKGGSATGGKTKASGKATAPAAAGKSRKARRNVAIELYTVNEKEVLMLRLRDDKGRPVRGLQKRFNKFLRCHHTNVVHAMNPRLIRLLYNIGQHYPGRRIEVVSGYRHPKVAKNPRSPHMKGLACDIRVAGVPNTELRDYLRGAYQKVGVGYYPNSSFVHLDVRKDKSAFWIDYSGPGERAVYSSDPLADLKSGRATAYRPTKIDQSWIEQADEGVAPAGAEAAAQVNNAPDPTVEPQDSAQ